MTCVGEAKVEFKLINKSFEHVFHIYDANSGVIDGVDFIRDRDLVI